MAMASAMDSIDRSEHWEGAAQGPTPSSLTIILDTNPHAWAVLSSSLPLSRVIANLLIFINAHLAINPANQISIIASHTHRAQFLYPKSPNPTSEDTEMGQTDNTTNANKYRPFAVLEAELLQNLRQLMDSTSEEDIKSTHTTQIAGALTLALSYINKASIMFSGTSPSTSEETSKAHSTAPASDAFTGLQSRILVLSVSGDLAHQYIPIMNCTFACQRLRIPIDIMKLAGDTVFLQQASDATKGTYMELNDKNGLLQYLMMAFLPDQVARKELIMPGGGQVDFRAACFCHRRVVDVGYVCSICLSIFCEPPPNAQCLTCSTYLTLGTYGSKPAVVPRKKKKKKKLNGVNGLETGSARGTPAPGE